MLVCILTVLAVSACGSSSVSSAVKNKLVNEFVSSGISKSKAEAVMNCLLPALKAHHVYTVADGEAISSTNPPSWVKTDSVKCAKQAGIGS